MSRFALAALLLAGTAIAADEEVVVTAPLEGSRIESLQGATVLKRDAIVTRLNTSIGEVLSGLPGVSSTFYGAGAGRPIIRGLGDDRIRVLENGIGTIDASSASPDHAVGADPLDARRIEVLRGAAALAYGGNAVGGVVNVIDETIPTRLPERGWATRGLVSYSSVDDGWQGGLGGTAAAGDVALNLDWSARETGDYDTPIGRMINSFVSTRSYAGGLSLVKDWGFVGAGAKRFETSYGLPPEAPGELGGHIELEQTRYEARGDVKLDLGPFTRLDFAGQVSDYAHTEFEGTGEAGTVFANQGYEGRIELHNGQSEDRLTGATGLQFSRTDFSAVGDESFIAPTVTKDVGLFTVQRWDTGTWGVEGGLRIEHRDLDNAVIGTRDFTPVSASLGAFWRPSENWFAGLTVARTERAPTNVELFANGPHLATGAFEVGDASLGLETATSLEGSLRYGSDIWTAELNVYRIGFDGYIALTPTGTDVELDDGDTIPEFAFVQRDATFTGGEISASVRLGQAGGFTFKADVAADLVRAEFKGGGDLPRIPPSTVTLGLEAESDAVTARVEMVDIAEQDDVAAFETTTPGSTVLNAHLAWRPFEGEDVTLLLDGRNLTDELVRVHASFLKDELPRPGRSIRVAISASY
ncbi:putative TonB-dependent receptor [Alphaproteobacteria bacterium SO-S41]|nr:putative TonB-dependent receptor [Alphaproteobacteria bacterium SO-S41]